MFILLISRGFPTKEYPQWGCFEKDQAEALVQNGHKVVAISVDARFKKHRGSYGLHHFESNGVEYYNYVSFPGKLITKIVGINCYRTHIRFFLFDSLYKKVAKVHGKPDVIYSHFYFNMQIGVQLKEKYHIPSVGIEHLGRFNEANLPSETNLTASYAFPKMDALIAVSTKLSRNIEEKYHTNCFVVNNMYGKEFAEAPELICSRKSGNKLVFVSVARIDYKKGFDVLIEGFYKAALPESSWELNIIGWGVEKDNIEKLIREKGLQNNVNFLGKKTKEEIVTELRNSDVFILASRLETFGIVFIEAMSQGLPVIGTICGGPEEIIDERSGLLIPSDDVEAMANAIKKMVSTYSQYDRRYIAEECQRRFSPQAIAGKLTEVFENVLKKDRNK